LTLQLIEEDLNKQALLEHQPCSRCGSSDALTIYMDNHTHCFSCEETIFPKKKPEKRVSPLATTFFGMPDRGISQRVCEKFGVKGGEYPRYFPLYKADKHASNKIRYENKTFAYEGDSKELELFGQHLFPAGSSKTITVTEGYEDAMAVYQMFGEKYPVVSVHSSSSASKDIATNFKYLSTFDTIVICFDKDDVHISSNGDEHYPGQEAAAKVAGMFPIGKVKVLTLEKHKDANDYLKAKDEKSFLSEWWKAPIFTPSGIKLGKDMWDEVVTQKKYETTPYPWDSLNDKTYGIRLSELVILTGNTGDGKSSILREIGYSILRHTTSSVGLLMLEETNQDTCIGLMSIEASKPLHLPDVRETVDADTFRNLFDNTINNDRIVLFDHFGSNNVSEVLSVVRHMHNLGCKYIILDHLSIIVSDQSGDERKQLDEISTKLKMLCMELNIAVIAVIHQNRAGEIRGTAGVEQLANIVIKISREKEALDEWRRNVCKLTVQKNRFCGRTGPGCWLFYTPETGRLDELSKEDGTKYEEGYEPGAIPLRETW
jgi:twinkle protein